MMAIPGGKEMDPPLFSDGECGGDEISPEILEIDRPRTYDITFLSSLPCS